MKTILHKSRTTQVHKSFEHCRTHRHCKHTNFPRPGAGILPQATEIRTVPHAPRACLAELHLPCLDFTFCTLSFLVPYLLHFSFLALYLSCTLPASQFTSFALHLSCASPFLHFTFLARHLSRIKPFLALNLCRLSNLSKYTLRRNLPFLHITFLAFLSYTL